MELVGGLHNAATDLRGQDSDQLPYTHIIATAELSYGGCILFQTLHNIYINVASKISFLRRVAVFTLSNRMRNSDPGGAQSRAAAPLCREEQGAPGPTKHTLEGSPRSLGRIPGGSRSGFTGAALLSP